MKNLGFRRPSLSAGLLFTVLTIRGMWIVNKIYYPWTFPSIICGFGPFFYWQKGHKRPKQGSLVICGFGIRGIFLGRNPRKLWGLPVFLSKRWKKRNLKSCNFSLIYFLTHLGGQKKLFLYHLAVDREVGKHLRLLVTFIKGSSINDVTQFWIIFDPHRHAFYY